MTWIPFECSIQETIKGYEMKTYKTEARERWGDTAAYREHEQKTKNYTSAQ